MINELKRIAKELISLSNSLYHGTNEQNGRQIIRDGFVKPGNLEQKRRGYLVPVAGHSYLAQDLKNAVIYTIGGDMIGHDLSDIVGRSGRYGYLFVFDYKDLKSSQPDEDDIGELIYLGSIGRPCPIWLREMAKNYLTSNQYKKVLDGEYIYWAQAGKKLVKLMSESNKRELIDKYNTNVATMGEIPFKQAWKFDKLNNKDLKSDASNFFNLAERIV